MVFSTAWKGFFDDGRSLEVALVRAGDQRGHKATDFVESLSHTPLEPSVIAMVGVCAGNPKLVQLGDLLVPKAISLDDGKQYAGGRQGRTETIPIEIDETLKGIAGVIEDNAPWLEYIPEELKSIEPPVSLKEERPPKIHMNEFVSGDNLKETADWDAMAERVGRKLTGYEMEGFGFYYGCKRYLGSSKRIFVKGVSDYASKDTKIFNKSYQKYCSASATALVLYLANLGDQRTTLFGTDDTDQDRHSLPEEVNNDLMMAVAELVREQWQRLLLCLGLNERVTSQYQEQSNDNNVRVCSIISDWKLKNGKEASVSKLVTACNKIGISEDETVKEYKRQTGRKNDDTDQGFPLPFETNQSGKQPREAAASSLSLSGAKDSQRIYDEALKRGSVTDEIDYGIIRKVATEVQDKWQILALELGFEAEDFSHFRGGTSTFLATKVIERWMKSSRAPTGKALLQICKRVSEKHVQKVYEIRKLRERIPLVITGAEKTKSAIGLYIEDAKVKLERKETAEGTFGREGGRLVLSKSQITLTVPEGAVTEPKTITLSLFLAHDFVTSAVGGKTMSAAILEFLPHKTIFQKKVTIHQNLNPDFLPGGSIPELNFFYCSKQTTDAEYTFMGSLRSSESSVNFEDKEIRLTNNGLVMNALSFCEVVLAASSGSSSTCLSFYHKNIGENSRCIRAVICSNCEENKANVRKKQQSINHAFLEDWSFCWRYDHSSVEIKYSVTKGNAELDKDEVVTFSPTDLCHVRDGPVVLNYDQTLTIKDDFKEDVAITATCTCCSIPPKSSGTFNWIFDLFNFDQQQTSEIMTTTGNVTLSIPRMMRNEPEPTEIDDILKMTVATEARDRWKILALEMGFETADFRDFHADTNIVSATKVIERWIKSSQAPTVKALLQLCELIGLSERYIREACKKRRLRVENQSS
ncbi:uncharacterized protein [Oscarella lobularis]|uniref:uncharacterized protein isoform X2 n=1 Tax=Oscarella lobularis TaxID=121494 RepID=UPI00331399D0